MDPYQPPESNLELRPMEVPKSIKTVYALMTLSLLLFIVEEMVLTVSFGELLDPSSYIFMVIWAGILLWLYIEISSRNRNNRSVFLFLGCLIAVLSVVPPLDILILCLSLAEALCFFVIYIFLCRRDAREWFS